MFKPPGVALAPGWAAQVGPALQRAAETGVVKGVSGVARPQGAALKLSLQGQARPVLVPVPVPVDGSALRTPDAPAAQTFAQSLYLGGAAVLSVLSVLSVPSVQRLAQVPLRLDLVRLSLVAAHHGLPGRRRLQGHAAAAGVGDRLGSGAGRADAGGAGAAPDLASACGTGLMRAERHCC